MHAPTTSGFVQLATVPMAHPVSARPKDTELQPSTALCHTAHSGK